MLNRYPLWKYVMLVVVIVVGLIMRFPTCMVRIRLFKSLARGVAASEQTLIRVQKTLQEEK